MNKIKFDVEKKRKEEENELLKKCLRADAQASASSLSTISLKPKMEKLATVNTAKSQKETLKKLIVKRKASPGVEASEAKQKKVEDTKKEKEKKPAVTPIKKVSLIQNYP